MKKGKGIARKIFWGFNILFSFLLLLSYLSPYISPEIWWPIAFMGLAYPILFIINFIFIIGWAVFRKWQLLLSLICILIGFNSLRTYVGFHFNSSKPDDTWTKVMSYNVRNFDVYNYKPKWQYNYENRNHIFDLLNKENPDVICFQEFYADSSGYFNTLDTLKSMLKAKNTHVVYTASNKRIAFFGLSIFSKYPIINKGEIIFNNNSQNNCIYADILMGTDTVRVYNVHYASIRLSPEDQIFTGNEKISKSTAIKKDSKKILQRLKHAFISRARQAEIVADHMAECGYPIILCGDFNDTPISYAYHLMRGKLNDSFISSGGGIERTYAGLYPAFRIDYILYSDEFDVTGYYSIKEKWSDHYPIQSYLKLKK